MDCHGSLDGATRIMIQNHVIIDPDMYGQYLGCTEDFAR